MMLSEHIKVGLNSVRNSRFRSFFTMLGIIVGVVSVITIVSLGEGVKNQIAGQVSDLGPDLISVKPGKVVERDSATGKIIGVNIFASTGIASVTSKDVESIKKLPGVESVAALRTISGTPTFKEKRLTDGAIIAIDPELAKVFDHKMEFGTYIDVHDAEHKTAVIGPNVADKLYGEAVPLGNQVSIRGQNFVIQGVFGNFSDVPISTGINLNNTVFISEKMAESMLGGQAPIYEVLIKKSPKANNAQLINSINNAIKQNHFGSQDFTVMDKGDAVNSSHELLRILTKMIVGMAGVTLLVGGIGIMNVMLVSVSERNREIGIRKSIGATDSQIRNQFILESTILSVMGAVLGVIVAAVLNIVLRIFTDLEPVLTWHPIVLSATTAVVVGVVFGAIPAIKASHKNPIESFRA